MVYPIITHESELDDLIEQILLNFPNNENDPQEILSSDDPVGTFEHTEEVLLSTYISGQPDNDSYNTYVSEQVNTSYDPSHEEALNYFDQSCNEATEQEEHEVMFEDALDLVYEYDELLVNSNEEESNNNTMVTDVNPSEGGCNQESANEPALDLDDGSNSDTVSQIECEAEEEVEFELNDVLTYLYYKCLENNYN